MSAPPELIVVRALTSSDLGIFAAHRKSATSKQRAININAKVAAAMLSDSVFATGDTELDCICTYSGQTSRSARHFGKVGKNWRLGGNKLEGNAFADIDNLDFALIRTPAGNDGSSPITLTFVTKAADRVGTARLVRLFETRLKQSMDVVASNDPIFDEVSQ